MLPISNDKNHCRTRSVNAYVQLRIRYPLKIVLFITTAVRASNPTRYSIIKFQWRLSLHLTDRTWHNLSSYSRADDKICYWSHHTLFWGRISEWVGKIEVSRPKGEEVTGGVEPVSSRCTYGLQRYQAPSVLLKAADIVSCCCACPLLWCRLKG
jgi:hypothetical protein